MPDPINPLTIGITISGTLDGYIYWTSKGISHRRLYKVPTDPQTAAQNAWRGALKAAVQTANQQAQISPALLKAEWRNLTKKPAQIPWSASAWTAKETEGKRLDNGQGYAAHFEPLRQLETGANQWRIMIIPYIYTTEVEYPDALPAGDTLQVVIGPINNAWRLELTATAENPAAVYYTPWTPGVMPYNIPIRIYSRGKLMSVLPQLL